MMNRLLILLLMAIGLNTSMVQAQHATRDMRDRDAVQIKTSPLTTNQLGSRPTLNTNGVFEDILWDFEGSGASDWTALDNDGDGYNWVICEDADYVYNGTKSLMSESYISSVGALDPDNWLISPQVPLSGTLMIHAMNYSAYFPDMFAVYACVGDPTNLDDFVLLADNNTPNTYWTQRTYDLSQFGGQMGCIAIRHYNSYNMYKLFIDDVSITYSQTPIPVITYEEAGDCFLVTATGEGHICLYLEDELVAEGEGSASYYVFYSDVEEEYCFSATAQLPGKEVSSYAVLNLVVPPMIVHETPAPEIFCELTEEALVVTAVGEGIVTLYIQYIDNWTGQMTTETYDGEGEVTVNVLRTDEYYYINYWAVAQYDDGIPGMTEVVYFVEVPAREKYVTDAPVIVCEPTYEGVLVSVTGNGWLCLYVYGELVADGEGCISYMLYNEDSEATEYTVSATAQEDGQIVSETVYEVVFVEGKTPVPEFTYVVEEDYYTFYAIAYEAEVYMLCNGVPVENPYTVYLTDEEQNLFFEIYALKSGCRPSDVFCYEICIPAKTQVVQGDVDGNGVVNITDVTEIIDYLLNNDGGNYFAGADVNGDGTVNITDVTALIDYLLNGSW